MRRLIGPGWVNASGMLTVVSRVGVDNGGIPVWFCACTCGGTTYVRSNHLTSGGVRSCGCLLSAENLTGQVFGELTVEAPARLGKAAAWSCRCSCGEVRVTTRFELLSADHPRCFRCACIANAGKRAHALAGERRGSLVALYRVRGVATHEHQAVWVAVCDCGRQRTVWAARFKRGGIRYCSVDCPLREMSGKALGSE